MSNLESNAAGVAQDQQECNCASEGMRCVDVRCEHFLVCEIHETFQYLGGNLHSIWTDQSAEKWKANTKELSALRPLSEEHAAYFNAARCDIEEIPSIKPEYIC